MKNIKKAVKVTNKSYLINRGEGDTIVVMDGDVPTQELYDYIVAHPEIPRQTLEEYYAESGYDPVKEEEERKKQSRITVLQARLDAISDDVTQDAVGIAVPNVDALKTEFRAKYKEICGLKGIEPKGEKA